MNSKIILQEIAAQINNFEEFNQESYYALINLDKESIERRNSNYYKATDLLETIFYYKQIKDALTGDEILELHSLCHKTNYQYLEKALKITNLSSQYIDELEKEEITHPVCEYHAYREYMNYTDDLFFEYLEIYRELIDSDLNLQVSNLLYQRDIHSIFDCEIRFQNRVLPEVFASLATKNTEKILISLIPYADYRIETEIGIDGQISLVKSNIMKLLYKNNQMEEDLELINLYYSIEKIFPENKYYHLKC